MSIRLKKEGILSGNLVNPHQILPIRYQWARNYYQCGIANNWTPEEISMQADIEQWKSPTGLTDKERKIILWSLGFFSTAESLTANNIVLAAYKHITNPECRQYMLRQAFEEAIHTDTFIYCCDSLGLDPDMIYTGYMRIPSIKKKDDFVIELTQLLLNPDFTISSDKDITALLRNLIGYYIIMEGIFFYAGFAMMLALKRQGKMVGIGQQFEYIMRDESIHLAYGADVINAIKYEHPESWSKDFETEIITLIKKAVQLECEYVYDACPEGFLGINPQQFCQYIEYIADRRLERIGIEKIYQVENPLTWMSQATDLSKEKNFFETRVTEYQTAASLDW
jgi:ribonucleoside-diphosphate reductase beta chain